MVIKSSLVFEVLAVPGGDLPGDDVEDVLGLDVALMSKMRKQLNGICCKRVSTSPPSRRLLAFSLTNDLLAYGEHRHVLIHISRHVEAESGQCKSRQAPNRKREGSKQ